MRAIALGLLLALGVSGLAWGQGASPASCEKMTWQNCALFTKQQMKNAANDQDPGRALRVFGTYWAPAFEKAYRGLSDEPSDLDKIQEEIKEKVNELNPIEWAKDAVVRELLATYLPRIAAFVGALGAVVESAPVQAAMIFFWPSSIANESTELRQTNESLNRDLAAILDPYMEKDWRKRYLDLVIEVRPTWKPAYQRLR